MIITLMVFVAIFSLGVSAYFNSKELSLAERRCHEIGGSPKIESSFMNLSYSFSCETGNN